MITPSIADCHNPSSMCSDMDLVKKIEKIKNFCLSSISDGEKLEGYPSFRGYRLGSWSSKRRIVIIGVSFGAFLLEVLLGIFQYFFEEGTLPKFFGFLSAVLSNGGIYTHILSAILALALLYESYLLSIQWRRHARVIRSLMDLNYKCTKKIDSDPDTKIEDFFKLFCEEAAKVLSYEFPKMQIGCAIRIYRPEEGYVTIARGGGLSPRRADSTQPLIERVQDCERAQDCSKLLKMINDKKFETIVAFVCDDTTKAREDGVLDGDRNGLDLEFSKEDVSLGVARLFSADKDADFIVGLFYITSNKKSAFHADGIDIYLFLRDYANHFLLSLFDKKVFEDKIRKSKETTNE